LAQADSTGAQPAIFDLDGADDQHFDLMAAPHMRNRILLSAAAWIST
jgi:hypothetical protein